jgi:DNA-binding transcriptional regulator YhcF (GntR family)
MNAVGRFVEALAGCVDGFCFAFYLEPQLSFGDQTDYRTGMAVGCRRFPGSVVDLDHFHYQMAAIHLRQGVRKGQAASLWPDRTCFQGDETPGYCRIGNHSGRDRQFRSAVHVLILLFDSNLAESGLAARTIYCILAVPLFMAKRATAFELSLQPTRTKVPAYKWLYSELRATILDGRLRPGARLPATRDLAQQYGLSRGTIVSAFEQLKSEGYLQGSVGSGTYVSKILPDELLQVASEGVVTKSIPQKQKRRLSDCAHRTNLFSAFELRASRAFRANLPALDLFPATLWAQIAARRLRRASMNFLMGCDSLGYRPLRDAVADYLNASRGANCVPEQVAITSGVQEALDLAARLFVNPGDHVHMENPGYPGAALAFESVGGKILPLDLDQDGVKLPGGKMRNIRLVYTTPGHQFPLGITMSLPRRLECWNGRENPER